MQQKYPVTLPVSPRVNWLLPALKLDIIHSHHPFLLGQTAAEKANDLAVPLVFTHHTRYSDYSHYLPLNQKLVKAVIENYLADYMRKCHHVVVPSESIKKKLVDLYGISRQITAVATGIDLSQWAAADGHEIRQTENWGDDTVLISVGRLAKEKNWPTLIKAVAPVLKKRSQTRLVLVGDGNERKSLQKLTTELGIEQQVQFTGNISHSEVIAHLKAADLFCFASVTETQGLVTMEAMAAGLPVVAVDASGTRDVVTHEQEGLLTKNDPAALTQAIETVLDNDSLRQRLAAAGLERAKTLSTDAQAQRLVSVYEQAIEDQKADHYVKVVNPKLTDKLRWRDVFVDLFEFGT
jgi:glycosyltransferase involved in cell wall biosynthesis